jgi:hypothetical protein
MQNANSLLSGTYLCYIPKNDTHSDSLYDIPQDNRKHAWLDLQYTADNVLTKLAYSTPDPDVANCQLQANKSPCNETNLNLNLLILIMSVSGLHCKEGEWNIVRYRDCIALFRNLSSS